MPLRVVLACAVLCTAHGCSKERSSRPEARHDGGAPRGEDAAVVVSGPRPALPAEERAELGGVLHVAAGHEGAFRIDAIDPAGRAAPVTLTPAGGSWFPVPGDQPLAIHVVDDGDRHVEALALLVDGNVVGVGPHGERIRSPSARGDVIVLEGSWDSFRDLYRLDRTTGKAARLTDSPQGNFEPSLSPDGKQVAFTSSRDGDAELYVMPTAGGAATRLTTFHRDDWGAAWSPDGAWIAFLSDRTGAARLHLVRPDGTGLRTARDGADAGEEGAHVWSPDGTRLAYAASGRDGSSEIWVVDVATGAARRVSAPGARDESPTWSPDGRHLAYVSTRDRRIDLWVARADGSAESRLTDTPEEEWIPRWRP